MPSSIAELVRSAPDWSTVDPRSPDVKAWLARAYRAVYEIDPLEAGVLRVHAQYLHKDSRRHSAEIAETLRRVVQKLAHRSSPETL